MTTELDRMLLQKTIELLRPLLNLGDENDLAIILQVLAWDSEALGITDASVFVPTVNTLSNALQKIEDLLEQESIALEDIADVLIPLATAVADIINLISSLHHPSEVPEDAIIKFGEDLLSFLIEHYLVSSLPQVAFALECLGIFKPVDLPEIKRTDGGVLRPAKQQWKLDLAAIGKAIHDPLSYIRQEFLTDATGAKRMADAVADLIGPVLAARLVDLGLTAGYGIVPELESPLTPAEIAAAQRFLIVSGSFPSGSNISTALRVVIALSDETNRINIVLITSGDLLVALPLANGTLSASLQGALQPLLINSDSVSLAGTGAPIQLTAELQYKTDPMVLPALRFGSLDSTHFEIGEIQTAIKVSTDSDGLDFGGTIDLKSLLLAIQSGDGDGFLNKVLPRDPIKLQADIGLDVSLRRGIKFRGSFGLELTLPLHIDLFGVLKLDSIYLVFQVKVVNNETVIEIIVAVTARVEIAGVVKGSISRIGIKALITFPPKGGNLGSANLAIGFKPPDGAGLSIDASVLVGGGYLSFDSDKEQYAGIVYLNIKDKIAITAIGILNTRLPDGRKTFSLLFILTAEFPPIQLGYGFALTGVGGLIGVNRTMMLDVLRDGIKNKTVDSILFPKDPIVNAPKIISDLQAIFPPAEGRFVFGPMVKIIWGGSYPVLSIELGILIEIPSPIRLALLGKITLALPKKNKPEDEVLVYICLDIIGTIDFDKGEVSIDGVLTNSRIALFPLTGGMALRLKWGSDPVFIQAIGGFNPRYKPPVGFPLLDRLALQLNYEENGLHAVIRLESYLAVTANSFQFGALIEVYAEMSGAKVSGFLGFDAMVEFVPFSFIVDLFGGVVVRAFGFNFSIDLILTLTGPKPFVGNGLATIEFFGKREFPIHFEVGDPVEEFNQVVVDTLDALSTELSNPRCWSATLPANASMLVSLRQLTTDEMKDVEDKILAHPLGELTVRESMLPLGVPIERFGAAVPTSPGPFGISQFLLASTSTGTEEPTKISVSPELIVRDAFARGQFLNLTEDQKLSSPEFEPFQCGHSRIGTNDIKIGTQQSASFEYDVTVIDKKAEMKRAVGKVQISDETLLRLTQPGMGKQTAMQSMGAAKFAGTAQGIKVQEPQYVVVSAIDFARHDTEVYKTYTEAEVVCRTDIAGNWQVVELHEVE